MVNLLNQDLKKKIYLNDVTFSLPNNHLFMSSARWLVIIFFATIPHGLNLSNNKTSFKFCVNYENKKYIVSGLITYRIVLQILEKK